RVREPRLRLDAQEKRSAPANSVRIDATPTFGRLIGSLVLKILRKPFIAASSAIAAPRMVAIAPRIDCAFGPSARAIVLTSSLPMKAETTPRKTDVLMSAMPTPAAKVLSHTVHDC